MSKAFTKDDDDAGFEAPKSSLTGIPTGPFRLTLTGARIASTHAKEQVREAVARAETLPRIVDPDRAALGVSVVTTTNNAGEKKTYRLVSPEERALIGDGCSIEGPIGSVLIGAKVGDVREVVLPRGAFELEVVALEGEKE